jgi:hypothetical protein
VRALPAHRKIAPVAQATVALDFDQAADIHLDLLAEIALDAALGFNGLAEAVDFFLGQVLDLFCFFHVGLGAQGSGAGLADAIDRGQADPDAFLRR